MLRKKNKQINNLTIIYPLSHYTNTWKTSPGHLKCRYRQPFSALHNQLVWLHTAGRERLLSLALRYTSTGTVSLILKSDAWTSRCGLEYWNQEQKKYNNVKGSGDANSIPNHLCCLDIPLSALSLRGIKLKTWNALAVGHQHVSTQPKTQVPARLYPGSRNSNSWQELEHGHITWEGLSHIHTFFTLD